MADDTITFTGKADQLIAEYKKMRAEAAKNEKQMKEQRELSKQAAREERERAKAAKQSYEQTRTPMERFTNAKKKELDLLRRGNIDQDTYNRRIRQHRDALRQSTSSSRDYTAAFALSTAAVTAGTFALRIYLDELKKVEQQQNRNAQRNVSVEQSLREVRQNFTADDTISNDQFDGEVKALANRHNIPIQVAAQTLGPALSAKGSKKNRAAFDAAEAALSFTKDPNQAAGLAGAAGDFSKFDESQDFRAILGFLVQSQAEARLTDVAQLGKVSAPAIAAAKEQGGSVESGMEIFAALTQLNTDPTGDTTSTAMVNLIAKLSKFTDTAGMKPIDAITHLQNNNEARTRFLSQNTFEAKASPGIRSLLAGDAKGLKALRQAQGNIGSLDASVDKQNVQTFESRKGFVQGRGTVSGGVSDVEDMNQKAIEDFELGGEEGAIISTIRDGLFKAIGKVDLPGFDLPAERGMRVHFRRASNTPEEALETSRQQLNQTIPRLRDEGDKELLRAQLQALNRVADTIDILRQDQKTSTTTSGPSPLQMNSRDQRGAR